MKTSRQNPSIFKLVLMFGPLLLFFVVFAVVVSDLRNPAITKDQCIITATGSDVVKAPKPARYIYRQSSNLQNEVSMRCDRLGQLRLNDAHLFVTPVETGQGANISRKRYQFWPDRWQVNVRTAIGQ